MDEGRLDELGWSMFEDYVAALLKAELGAGVEAWGRHGDFGRDCYCPSPLRFPGNELADGPFVFQAKFVAGANATGAKCLPALKKAIAAEAARIGARCEARKWDAPAAYVLVTNCPVQASQRQQVEQPLRDVCPNAIIHTLTGRDLQAIARRHPDVRRAFPQIMGLGDLRALIADSVNAEVVNRSRAALDTALALASVYVPTVAYEQAQSVLNKHYFAVLEGPPEMGKTAISYMIGATRAFDGWEVHECRDPGDFFRLYDADRSQYFIVDDAFGRTEYDPTLGRLWEKDFGKIVRRLDGRHWVCWTSRRHILERALRSIDLESDSRRLPSVAAVLVDASRLTIREKTLILFRHAQSESKSTQTKAFVRRYGRRVVKSDHFTPERIRRFVKEAVPELCQQLADGVVDDAAVQVQVDTAIANPTEAMQKSFRALSTEQRAVLYALTASNWGAWDNVAERYAALVPAPNAHERFDVVVDDLTQSFIKVAEQSASSKRLEWVHPSVRDLVIEQLCAAVDDRRRFMTAGAINAVMLALSDEGGEAGKRRRPMLVDAEDWRALTVACERVIASGNAYDLQRILETLEAAADSPDSSEHAEFDRVVRAVCAAFNARWDRDADVQSWKLLEAFTSLSSCIQPFASAPNLKDLWSDALQGLERATTIECALYADETLITEFLRTVRAIAAIEPRLLSATRFPADHEDLLVRLERILGGIRSSDYSEPMDSAVDTMRDLLESVECGQTVPSIADVCRRVKTHIESISEELDQRLERSRRDEDSDYRPEPVAKSEFGDAEIEAILSDLEPKVDDTLSDFKEDAQG